MGVLTVEQLLNTATLVLEDLGNLIVRSCPPMGGPDRLRVSLVLTIAEQFEAVIRLAQAQMCTHATTHARSMIEALVAMKMLEFDNDYVDQMMYEKLRGERKVYNGLLANPDLPDDQKATIKNRYDTCVSDFELLHSAGYRPKAITNDIGTAGLSHLAVPYSMLCAFSHNDLAILAFRHQGEKSMVYKQGDTPEMVQTVISTALMVVMDATSQFGSIAKFPDGYFDPIFSDMNIKWRVFLDSIAPIVEEV
jgi:hypothetical protein